MSKHLNYFLLILVFDMICSFVAYRVGYEQGINQLISCEYNK